MEPSRDSSAELSWCKQIEFVVNEISIHANECPGISFLCAKDEMRTSRK